NVTVSGTGDNGDTISVTITGGSDDNLITTNPTTTTVANGTWSVTGINASGLPDGPVTYAVTETDANGNTTTITPTATKTTVQGPPLTNDLPATANTSLQITNAPAFHVGHLYTIQVDNEHLLVQPANNGQWYIIGRGVDATTVAAHNAGAPIQILSEAAQPT